GIAVAGNSLWLLGERQSRKITLPQNTAVDALVETGSDHLLAVRFAYGWGTFNLDSGQWHVVTNEPVAAIHGTGKALTVVSGPPGNRKIGAYDLSGNTPLLLGAMAVQGDAERIACANRFGYMTYSGDSFQWESIPRRNAPLDCIGRCYAGFGWGDPALDAWAANQSPLQALRSTWKPRACMSLNHAAACVRGTAWTRISSPPTPPPSPTRTRPLARTNAARSLLMPGLVGPMASTSTRAGSQPVSSTSSRRAAASSVSPACSSPTRPAGSSIVRAPSAVRGCSTNSSSSAGVTATITTAMPPGWVRSTYSQRPRRSSRSHLPSHSTSASGRGALTLSPSPRPPPRAAGAGSS